MTNLIQVDLALTSATIRRWMHPDPISRRGNMLTIDSLLDRRLELTGGRR